MTGLKKTALIAGVILAAAGWMAAQTPVPPQTFTTTIYFDYSYNASTDGYLTGTPTAQALSNKFAFRRAYFTYENKISDYLKFRFRYDADNTANITSVNFVKSTTSKDDKLRPFIKHAYIEWSRDFLQSKINIGMIETISFKLAEDRWGYRSVAKTLLDGYKDITGVEIDQTSADLGVTWKGTLAKELRFGLGVHNGSHYSHVETDKFKKLSGFLQVVPIRGFSVVGFMDYEKQPLADGSAKSASTYKFDAYFDMIKNLNFSFEWFRYDNKTLANKIGGWSAFATYKITPDKLGLFARYDAYRPNVSDSSKDMSLIIVGLDWFAWGSYGRLQPNVWIWKYNDSRKGDIVANLTFFLSF
jgi:hypothetical protein